MSNLPRQHPCPSCPYRCDVPSGIWDASEYEKLPGYDGEMAAQAEAGATRMFFCHQQDGRLCAGWVGHRDPNDLLALRLGLAIERVSIEVLDYTTQTPLFPSGAAAAEHGMAEVEAPDEPAVRAMAKIVITRGLRR